MGLSPALAAASERAVEALALFMQRGIEKGLETRRISACGYATLVAGCSREGRFTGSVVGSHLLAQQAGDGGWIDVEETTWCLGYLVAFGERYSEQIGRAKAWLEAQRLPCGAWGKSLRDRPRIPITGLMSVLLPDVVDRRALEWLVSEWEKDLSSPVQLTYKGAFFLLSQKHPAAPGSMALVKRTLDYLCSEQNEDGGFGPWKGHPVGSDPWSTGVVLWGLAAFPRIVPEHVVQRSVSWLESNQLPGGLWPYHYLDDGTSLALIGLSSAINNFQILS